MKIETKEIYKCEFCNKLYQLKHFAAKHEQLCTKNPENKRACFGCSHLEKKQTTIYHDSPLGGENEQQVHILFCNKKQIYLYPPRVQVKQNMYDLGNDSNEPMPKVCSDFSDYTKSDGFSF